MATRSILGSINNAASLSLINGTVDIIANSLSSNSLAPGTTVKTDTGGSLISADLTKSDIVDLGDVISNPLSGDLDAGGSDILNVGNINTTTLNSKTPFYQTTTEDLDMNAKNIENVSNLEVTTINNRGVLYTPSIVNLNMNNFNINNVGNINATTLNSKTPFYQTTTVDLDMNNNAINNVSIINFPTGQYISGQDGSAVNLYTEGDITLACSQVVIGDNIATNYTLPTVRGADNSIMTLGTDGASSWSNTLVNQVGTNSSNITTLQNKTQYQTVNVPAQTTIFTGIVNASTSFSIGNAQPNQTGYVLPPARPLTAGYVMVTPASSGNTLQFQVAADASKIQNLTASTGQSTFTGILNVGSDLKVNGVSTLVGGITSNTKITLTKNIIEIQEDNVQTQAITIGNLLTTGYALPRTTNGIAGSDLRLLSDGNLSFYSPGSIRAYRVDTVPDATTLTFNFANTLVNLSGSLSTQNIVGDFSWQATGAQYTGAITRPFIANFSVILLNENKDIVPVITLTLATIGSIDHSTQVFEHTHNRARQWVLQATGVVSQNQIITARIKSTLAGGAATTIGSPQLNITLL